MSSNELSPLGIALRRLFVPNAPYRPLERLVVLAIIARMSKKRTVAWPSIADIAKRTGMGPRTVSRWLTRHLDGPAPLLARSWKTGRRTPLYELVRDPEAFAAARDQVRADKANAVRRKRRDMHRDVVELQRQRNDFGGPHTRRAS